MRAARFVCPIRVLLCVCLLLAAACGTPPPSADPEAALPRGGAPAAPVAAPRGPDPSATAPSPAAAETVRDVRVEEPAASAAPAPQPEAPLPPARSTPQFAASGPAPQRARELPPPAIGARAAVVVDGDSGAVLYEQDAHEPLPPASTTKILTALLALERGRPDDEVEVHLDGRAYWGSVMGLVNGDRFTLRDLLYGLMLPSGNDAAYVIAAYIAGSERDFAGLMNTRMRELGLVENSFINATGLGRTETNLVSAHDLAQLARYAMTSPEFAALVRARSWTARGSRMIGMRNLNELLFIYPGADGVKIGWGGRTAGHTIVGSAARNGHRVFVALLNTPDRAGESAALLNWAFASFTWEGR